MQAWNAIPVAGQESPPRSRQESPRRTLDTWDWVLKPFGRARQFHDAIPLVFDPKRVRGIELEAFTLRLPPFSWQRKFTSSGGRR